MSYIQIGINSIQVYNLLDKIIEIIGLIFWFNFSFFFWDLCFMLVYLLNLFFVLLICLFFFFQIFITCFYLIVHKKSIYIHFCFFKIIKKEKSCEIMGIKMITGIVRMKVDQKKMGI